MRALQIFLICLLALLILNTHAPLRKYTRKEKKLKVKPWLNKTLLKSIKKKKNMFKDLHKNFNQQSLDKYKAYGNALNKTIQGAKQMYYNKYFLSNKIIQQKFGMQFMSC